MTIEQLQLPILEEFRLFRQEYGRRTVSEVPLLGEVESYLNTTSGKQLRPLLVLLSAKACGTMAEHHILLAAAVELLHNATLMHDDVIDEGLMRRGIPSTNSAFGNKVAVLGGDYLFTKAYNATIKTTDARICRTFSDALTTLVQGELTQMSNTANLEVTEESYFKTIYSKTSVLFEITTKIPGLVLNCSDAEIESLAKYGRNIGYAFQIADDILDYTSDSSVLGQHEPAHPDGTVLYIDPAVP